MESSDDSFSFAWTSASSVTSSECDSKGNNMRPTTHTKSEDDDSTDNKKKLQKRLFEEDPGSGMDEPPRKRKKKLKREREKTPSSPRVKRESESDAEAELARRVKQEQASDCTTAVDTNSADHDTALTSESEFANSDKKSKKSKKRKRNSSLNPDVKDMIVEDMFSAEETVVENRPRKASEDLSKQSHRKSISKESIKTCNENGTTYTSKEFISDDSSSSDENSETRKQKKRKRKTDSESQVVNKIASESEDTGGHTQETSFQSVKNTPKKSKISDFIQYEEEEDNLQTEKQNTMNGHPVNATTQSTRLKRFMKSNPQLKAITGRGGMESLITRDDEVWVLKCPHEVDISSLKGKDLHLDTKCKLKIDGQAYDGSINEERGSIAILSSANNQIIINSVPLNGTVTFRKRVPKPHFFEDNIVLNNQTNFIPLPDTKRRHPLFGPDYKKAVKIPSAIKERLKSVNEPQQELSEKKKKRKHREVESVEECIEVVDEPYKKKKKKKHRLPSEREDDEEPPRKKIKKVKNEVSADTWESEKAIEESLFNF